MKQILFLCTALFFVLPTCAYAAIPAVSNEITSYTSTTLSILTSLALAASVLFLIKGGFGYITATGNPQHISYAKQTIKNALIGLVLVLCASFLISVFQTGLHPQVAQPTTPPVSFTPITPLPPSPGLVQVLIDAVTGFMQTIVESATKPIMDALFTFLTTTPSLLTNSVIFNFWLTMVGITDSLFVLVVALLGLHVMSATTLGFDEIELTQLLPKVALAFLGANTSLFLADYVIVTCNALVTSILSATGGLNQGWIQNSMTVPALLTGNAKLITLIFLCIFLIVSIVLLLMYITRLIAISLAGVLSPFIFLLWALPRFSDFAEIAIKSYCVTVFSVFIHVVIIQLASSFITLPGSTDNALMSIIIGIGLLFTLLETPSFLLQLVLYNTQRGILKKMGGEIINVMSSQHTAPDETYPSGRREGLAGMRTPRRAGSL